MRRPSPLALPARAAARFASGLSLAVLLAACPQDIVGAPDAGEAGPDAGHETPSCERAGPALSCLADKAGLLAVGELVRIDCQAQAGGREVAFEGPEVDHPRASRQGSFSGDSGYALVQLLGSEVGADFGDTTLHVDLGVRWADDEGSCTWTTVEINYAGNLWVADPGREAVVALNSAGVEVGQLQFPEIRKPRLLARVHDGILVGGTDAAGQSVLVVYSRTGARIRGPLEDGGQLSGRVLHSAAEDGHGVLYVATGQDETDGRLYRSDGASMTEVALGGKLARGVAALPDGAVAVGLVKAAGAFLKIPAGGQGEQLINPPYADSNGQGCQVESVFALAPTTEGLWLSSKEQIDGSFFGHELLVAYGTNRRVRGSAHVHPDRGSLALASPHDWLAEVISGVFVATRKDSTTVEVLDPESFGAHLPNGRAWGGLQGQPRGLVRLR